MNQAIPTRDVKAQILDTAQRIMGHKGFSAVGLNEVLKAAGVPKGSFYHYFGSKEAFGVALLERYFRDYLVNLNALLDQPGGSSVSKVLAYFQQWLAQHDSDDPCLVVKLGAEVSDLSAAMRDVLAQGTAQIVARLARNLELAQIEDSLPVQAQPEALAASLYQLWLGAAMLAKLQQNAAPLQAAMTTTRQLLGQ